MATDLASLEVVITERGGEETQRALDNVAASGERAERATAGLTQAQAELISRSQQLVQAANAVNVKSADATGRLVTQAAEVRSLAQQYGGLAEAEANAARVTDILNQRTRAMAAATAAASTEAAVATEAQAAGAVRAAASSGVLSRALGGLGSAAGLTGAGVGGLAGSLASMVIGGAVITGVIAGIDKLVGVYRDLTKSEREAKEAADAFKQSDAGIAARARAQAAEQAVAGDRAFQGGLLTPRIETLGATKEITEAMKAAQGLRAELAKPFSINLDFANNLNPLRLRDFNTQVAELQRQFAAGKLSSEQFEHGLTELERAFPGFERQIEQLRELGSTYDAAAKAVARLQAAEANRVAEGRASVLAFGVAGTSFDQGGDAAVRLAEQRKALQEAQTRAAAAASRGTFGVQDIDNQSAAIEQATASWKNYVIATGNAALANLSYAQALSQHNAVAEEFLRTAQAEIAANQQVARTLAVQAEVTRGTGEIEKLRALNSAYRESELALRVLSIQLDATNQKRQNKLQYEGADLTRVNALVDATARERIQQALLSDQLERENRLRTARNANAGALEAAVNARSRANMTGPDAEVQAIRDRAQEEIDGAQRAHDAKLGLTRAEQATEDAITRERIANIREVAAADLERLQRARQEATRESVRSTVRDADAETAGIEAMVAAELAGGRAVEAMRIQLAGNEAVQRALNEATARGTTVTQEQAGELRRSAEELERTRINAEKLRAVYREVAGAANQFFTDVFNRKNPGPALAERIKQEIIGALSEAVARPITVKIGKILGLEPPEDKQIKAARDMNTAADKQLRAAQIMAGQAPSGGGNVPGIVIPPPPQSAAIEQFKRAIGIAGAGLGGYGAGYGIGQMTGSGVLGAIGGAAAGAKMGAAFGAPGVVVGAIAGFAGGILGAGDAAKEAAARLEEARKVFQRNWDSIVAEIRGDDLAGAIAAAGDKFDQLRQQYIQTISVSGVLTGEFQQGYGNIADLQKRYVEMLKQEAAAKARSQIATYRERELRAEGKTEEADAVAAKEERQELIDSFGQEIDATERQILAAYDAAAAAEKNTAALGALTTAVRGGPSGVKLNGYIQQYGAGVPYPASPMPWTPTTLAPGLPIPQSPQFSQAGASNTGKVATQQVILQNPVFQFPNVTNGDEAAKAFLAKLDATKNAAFGLNGTRAQALERM